MESTQEGGTYLYAVVPKEFASRGISDLSGVEQAKVYSIDAGELAAVVSDTPTRGELRPERRLLAAHQQVLQRVTDASPVVLPVSFGTVAENPEGVRTLLERYQQDLTQQMQQVEGKVEMGVRVSYAAEKPSVFEFLVASNAALREARDRFVGIAQPSREDKIDLGQKADAALNAAREEYASRVEQAIGDLGTGKRNPPRNESEFVNLAFLVGKDKRADFDAAVESLAKQFPDSFRVEELGPYPPYDFVNLHLKSL